MEGNLRLFINSLDNHCASASASDVGIISASMENAINIFHLLYLYWNIRESCFEIVDFCNFIGLFAKALADERRSTCSADHHSELI